jgi:hypothetical protein
MGDPTPQASPLDVRAALESASQRMEVGELLRAGHRRVQVLDRKKVESLIHEAVERALSAGSGDRIAVEVQRVEAEAKRRFDELMARHQEVQRLKVEADDALRDLALRLARGDGASGAPDLEPLARQVAAMGAVLRAESPAADAAGSPILQLLRSMAGRELAPGDDRLDRMMYQIERLAAAVEATERAMKRFQPGSGAAGGAGAGPARALPGAGAGNVSLFQAILEENLKLSVGPGGTGEKT